MSEQERREPAVDATVGGSDEAITLGRETLGPSVGERIRTAREAAGLSAADLAQPLNLDLKVIERIERDELDAVPGRPYILAYLRAWAGQLGLDADELIAQYNAQRVPASAAVQGGTHPTLDVMEPAGGGLFRRLAVWLGILIVIVIVVFALSRLDAERVQAWWADWRGETAEAPDDADSIPIEDAENAEEERPDIEGALDEPPAPPTGEPEESDSPQGSDDSSALPGDRLAAIHSPTDDGGAEENLSAATDETTPESDDSAESGEGADETSDEPAQADQAGEDDAAEADVAEDESAEAGTPVLLLRATSAESWVEVRDGNGDRLMYDVLAAGEEREFTDVEGPFSLVVGQPDGLEVEYRGEPVELDGGNGDTGVLRTTVGDS